MQLTHRSTFELEEGDRLGVRGDCVACIDCQGGDGARRCATLPGLAKLFIVALQLHPPRVEGAVVDGLSPAREPERLIVRRSCYRSRSLIVGASRAAAQLPQELRRLLASGFTRCLALLVVLSHNAPTLACHDAPGPGPGR